MGDYRQPVLFFGHGSPLTIYTDEDVTRTWNSQVNDIPTPKAILVISAHWYVNQTMVCANLEPETIHDFYGFPDFMYDQTYPARGSEELADRVSALLGCEKTLDYGLDHGAWTVLMALYPEHNIPVVQLSVNYELTFREAFVIGRKLKTLRDEGILIIGSGGVVHNLRMITEETDEFAWAKQFDEEIIRLIQIKDYESIIKIKQLNPSGGAKAIPTPDHFFPLLYSLGAVEEDDEVTVFTEKGQFGSLTLTGYRFSELN